MRNATLVISALALSLVLAGCENFFTSSPLAFLQRDPASLSAEQQIQYAEDALTSGDTEAMESAYEVLKDSDDPETQLLAADLALGAAELEGAVTEAVAGIAAGDDVETTLETALDGFTDEDLALMEAAATLVDDADAETAPSSEQYVYAAIGLVAVAVDSAGDFETLDGTEPEIVKAEEFLQAAVDQLNAEGESTELVEEIQVLLDGLA